MQSPRPGAKSVTNAMLEVGNDLGIPELPDLRVNTDSTQLRQQLGRRIGSGDTRSEPAPGILLFATAKTHPHHLARRQAHPVARHPPHSPPSASTPDRTNNSVLRRLRATD